MTAEVPLYRLIDLRVERAGRTVLDIPSLEIQPGRVIALVGPNGAGKTTLLQVLAFLLAPTSGRLEFNGRPVAANPRQLTDCRRQVTYVAQTPLLFRRSVRANLTYGLRARRIAADGRVEDALQRIGLAGFADRPAWKLSGGESQRVAIARALAIDPPVYLFDELTANIDREHAPVVESVVAALGAAGKTVLLTTHNLTQAYRLGDSLVTLSAGKLAPFPLINLLRGVTSSIDGVNYFVSNRLRIELPVAAVTHAIAIDPDAIILSSEPVQSSARNCFPGQILKVERDAGGVVVTVDCGQPLVARITTHSYQEMALNVGMHVFLTFKSAAVHLLDAPDSPATQWLG